jgi:5'/3'-nucleotidase
LSMPASQEEPNFEMLKSSVQKVLQMLFNEPRLPLVNVNFPEQPPKGVKWTRQSVRHYDGKVVPGEDPMGRKHFWFSVVPIEETEEGTDRWAVEQGYVSMTPLSVDLTNEKELAAAIARQPTG